MAKDTLGPDDFPIEVEKEKLKTNKNKTVASTISENIAEEIAGRLNEQAHSEEENRWSA